MGAIKHAFQSAKPDSGDPSQVSSNAWNDAHDMSTLLLSDYPKLEDALRASAAKPPLINGWFNINQLKKSGTVTLAAGAYGHDGWLAGTGGCTYTFAASGGKTTITITAGTLRQVAEGSKLRSGNYTLAWSGTAQARVGAGAYAVSPVTTPCTAGTKVTVEFGAGTLTDVRMHAGTTALPYFDLGDDVTLRHCQRYCFRLDTAAAITTSFLGPITFAPSAGAFLEGFFPVEMLTVPSVAFEGAIGTYSAFNVATSGYILLTGTPAVNAVTTPSFYLINLSLASSGSSGLRGYLAQTSTPANSVRFEARMQP